MKDRKILASWIMTPDGIMMPSMHRRDYRTHVVTDSYKRIHNNSEPEPDLLSTPLFSVEYLNWHENTTLVPDQARHSMIDGGTDYLKRGGVFTEMTVYDDDPFEVIRRFLCRGSRGINNDEPLTYVPLFAMDEEWLKACIKYNRDRNIEGHNKWYQMELDYRDNN